MAPLRRDRISNANKKKQNRARIQETKNYIADHTSTSTHGTFLLELLVSLSLRSSSPTKVSKYPPIDMSNVPKTVPKFGKPSFKKKIYFAKKFHKTVTPPP